MQYHGNLGRGMSNPSHQKYFFKFEYERPNSKTLNLNLFGMGIMTTSLDLQKTRHQEVAGFWDFAGMKMYYVEEITCIFVN